MFRLFKRHVSDELSSYIDNQLSEEEKQVVEKHLSVCPSCARELTELRGLSEKLKTWTVPELGPGFDNAVAQRIVRREVERGQVKMDKKQWTVFVPVGALAGILVFALVAGQLYTKRGIQGRMRESADQIGEQFSPAKQTVRTGSQTYASYAQRTSQYEPYYARTVMGEAAISGAVHPQGYEYALGNGDVRDRAVAVAVFEGSFDNFKNAGISAVAAGRYADKEYISSSKSELNTSVPYGQGPVIVIQPTLPATGEGEKIIRIGTVTLEVEDGKDAYKKASEICRELGGYLGASNFYKDREDREAGTITMRIPKDKFLSALDRLGALGKVENVSTNSRDVGQEYANLKSQLDATMVVYQKMLEALQKRQTTIPEAIRLESELTPILMRIESLKNQIEFLNNAVSFTTITVNFHEARISLKVLKESGHFIRESILLSGVSAVKFLAQAIPVAIVVFVWLLIATVAAFGVKYLVIRFFKRR